MSDLAPYWSKIQFFHEGDDYFSALLTDIEKAQISILLEFYIFEVDRITTPILDALERAHSRGVEVKINVDGIGSYYWIPSLRQACEKRKLEFTIYHPVPRTYRWFRRFLIPFFFHGLRMLRLMNRRTHRKMVILDEKTLYTGSLNMTQIHSTAIMGTASWRDTSVRLEGDGIADVVNSFRDTWTQSTAEGLARFTKVFQRQLKYSPRRSHLRLNVKTQHRLWLYRNLVKRIRSAKDGIFFTTAYFLPKRSLLRSLIKAAKKGIPVQLIIPGKSDFPAVKWAAREMAIRLIKSGVQIYEYRNRNLHAKYSVIDDWATVGSFNLNYRSLLLDLEIEAVFNDPESISELKRTWYHDQMHSRRCSIEDFQSENFVMRILSRIAFRLRYMM